MSMMDDQRGGGISLQNMETNGKLLIQAVNGLRQAIIDTFPRITGTFTVAAAASTVVPNTSVTSTSVIQWTPTNAAAAGLLSSASNLYLSARTPGVSFTVSTSDGAATGGTGTFSYILVNPS